VRTAAALVAVVAALVASAPPAAAAADQFCVELGAHWDGVNCTASVVSNRKATMDITLSIPGALLDDPAAGPVLREYHRKLIDAWRHTGDTMVRDSVATTDYQLYPGPGAVQSLVMHEMWQPDGVKANNAYRSFIFDMATGRRLSLADLFKPGVDPLQAIPPAAAAVLPAALDSAPPAHEPDTYPFTVQEWQPGPQGNGFSGDYRAFGLSRDHLILHLPDAPMAHEYPIPRDRFVWSMDGGTVTIEIPLSALAGSLRQQYGGD
jgi:hypothetical protein